MDVLIPRYSVQSPSPQNFSLPYPIILHLLETPSHHQLLKLQKTCKILFIKKCIFVTEKPVCCSTWDGPKLKILCGKYLDFGESKYWFTNLDCLGSYSILRPHIYRVTLSKLSISGDNLSRTDIDFLLSNNKMDILSLDNLSIRDDNGVPVSIDYVLGKVLHVKNFCYDNRCEIYSNQSLKQLNSIPFFKKLENVTLYIHQTSEDLDVQLLKNFIVKNMAFNSSVEIVVPRNAWEVAAELRNFEYMWNLTLPSPSCNITSRNIR